LVCQDIEGFAVEAGSGAIDSLSIPRAELIAITGAGRRWREPWS